MSLSNPIQVNAQVQESGSTNPKSSKRKVTEDRQEEEEEEEGSESDGDSDSEEVTHINTTFTFVAPTSIDFHALKALLNQLFHTHSQDDSKININTLSNGILERAGVDLEAENGTGNGGQEDAEMKIKPSVGTVVKVEGEEGEAEGDPFAMISAVDLKSTSTDPSSTNLRSYFLSTLPKSSKISSLLSSSSSSITLLLHSRLSNLPFQISIPCYRLIHSEQSELLKERNESLPEYAMLFSRCFKLNANHWENEDEGGDDEDKPRGMKKRKGGKKDKKPTGNKSGTGVEGNQVGSDALGYFNPEDEIVSKFASHVETFSFPAPKSADPSLFEAPLLGLVALVKWEKIPEIVDQIEVEVERMGQRLNGAVDEEAMGLD